METIEDMKQDLFDFFINNGGMDNQIEICAATTARRFNQYIDKMVANGKEKFAAYKVSPRQAAWMCKRCQHLVALSKNRQGAMFYYVSKPRPVVCEDVI